MSVSETEKECPLCMEALDWDDLGFFPCSCGYQICRFCWHRLRTDENGLCPACRQAFPDIPVSFNPEVSAEELKKQKKRNKERRSNKDQVFKPQDLATLRVVQKNLVFVIGLSSRLTQEDLKKEFAHFGKIIKFVHNKSTAYITYSKPEEAIRAIRTLNASAAHETAVQNLQLQSQLTNGTSAITLIPATTTPANLQQTANNSIINNNVAGLNSANFFLNAMSVPVPPNRLKASLGTTKYCNHFLRSQQCPKVGECMYLHEIAEAEASFTKEQMQAGKHVEYEKKLMDSYLAKLDWQTVAMVRNANPPSTSIQVNSNKGLQLDQQQISQHQSQHQPPQIQQPQPQTQPQTQLQTQTQPQPHHHQLNHHQQQQQPQQQPQEPPQQYHDQNIISELSTQALQNQLQSQNQQSQIQFHQQKQQQQQQQQHLHKQLVSDTDSEDDGLDFDPISVSTSGLRDLLDQQVQQAKQMQMQTYLQQLNSNQSLANVFFQQNNRLNHPSTMTTTGTNGLISDNSFNSHTQTLQTLAGLNNSANQQQQALWQNLSAWTSFLQRSGYGFENSR